MLNKNKKQKKHSYWWWLWCLFTWVPFKETKDKSAVGMLQSRCLEQNVLMEEWVFRGQCCTPTTCLAIYCMLVKQFKTHSCHYIIQHKFSVALAHKAILLTLLTSIPYRTSEMGFPDKKGKKTLHTQHSDQFIKFTYPLVWLHHKRSIHMWYLLTVQATQLPKQPSKKTSTKCITALTLQWKMLSCNSHSLQCKGNGFFSCVASLTS